MVLGLVLDVIQLNAFASFTEWVTKLEKHETLDAYRTNLVKKQFFFVPVFV